MFDRNTLMDSAFMLQNIVRSYLNSNIFHIRKPKQLSGKSFIYLSKILFREFELCDQKKLTAFRPIFLICWSAESSLLFFSIAFDANAFVDRCM